jgi:hypothetical protein
MKDAVGASLPSWGPLSAVVPIGTWERYVVQNWHPKEFLKKRVAKKFDGTLYYGDVKEWIPATKNDEGVDLWLVHYEDGDWEDLEKDELVDCILLTRQTALVPVWRSPRRKSCKAPPPTEAASNIQDPTETTSNRSSQSCEASIVGTVDRKFTCHVTTAHKTTESNQASTLNVSTAPSATNPIGKEAARNANSLILQPSCEARGPECHNVSVTDLFGGIEILLSSIH